MRKVLNAAFFQTVWWACVAGTGRGWELPAVLYGATLACVHLVYTERRLQELKLAASVVLMGIVVDSTLQYFSIIDFHGWALGPLSPYWLWLLWAWFAMTLNSSLAFLKSTPWMVSALAGLLLGPINYYAGAAMGAASFDSSFAHVAAIGLMWAIALPTMVFMAGNTSSLGPSGPA